MSANTRCSRCGAPMTCNPGDCWCDREPVLPVTDLSKGCYCPSCLKSLTEASGRDQRSDVSGSSP
jgi:hypothetical protein